MLGFLQASCSSVKATAGRLADLVYEVLSPQFLSQSLKEDLVTCCLTRYSVLQM